MEGETPYNERELKDLENEIRRITASERPYERSTEMPDPAYWATFRTRVMASVESQPSVTKRALEWLAGHLLGTSLIGAAAAAAIVISVFGPPGADAPQHDATKTSSIAAVNQLPTSQTSQAQSPLVQTPKQSPKTEASASVRTLPSSDIASNDKTTPAAKRNHVARAEPQRNSGIDPDAALASATIESMQPLLVSTESDYPVSLNDLSDTDLEFVYDGLTSLDSAE